MQTGLTSLSAVDIPLLHQARTKKVCALCHAEAPHIFTQTVLKKYDVAFYQCPHCDLIQTEAPFWLTEIPWPQIASLDTGAVQRARTCVEMTLALAFLCDIGPEAPCLDLGGGTGLFVRMMRDAGFNFRWHDEYASNVYAGGLQGEPSTKHTLVTCFEVFEHLPDPAETLERLFAPAHDYVLVSTALHQNNGPDWWYYCFDVGGHVVFYSARTMSHIAERYGYTVSCGRDFAFFVKRALTPMRRRVIEGVVRRARVLDVLLMIRPALQSRITADSMLLRERLLDHQGAVRPGSSDGMSVSTAPVLSRKRRLLRRAVELSCWSTGAWCGH